MARWTFDDYDGGVYIMEVNPNQGGTMGVEKNLSIMTPSGPNAPGIVFEGQDPPRTSSISGVALTRAQVEALELWYSKQKQIQITDDLGRTTSVRVARLKLDRGQTRQHEWRHIWTMQVSELDW